MTDLSPLLWMLLVVPAVGSGMCLLLPTPRAILAHVMGMAVATALVAVTVAGGMYARGPITAVGGWLYLDALSAYHLLVMMIVFGLGSVYALGYFREELARGDLSLRAARRFGALWLGALGTMSLVLVSNNLGILWVGIEGTTLLTAFLICIHRTPASLEAMWKYLIICSVGVAFAFMGTLLVGAAAEQLHLAPAEALLWTVLQEHAGALNPVLVKVAFLFLLVGYGTKVGLAPMHSWLPDAHSQAPAPVSALFSGFMLNTALYCIMRYVPLVEGVQGGAGWSMGLLVLFGIVSLLIAAAFIYFQQDVKRLLAYSTVEHMGIITLGIGLGGIGTFAALFHTLNHSLCKSVAFFSAGRVGQVYGTHDMSKVTGSMRAAPVWGKGLFISLLALIGMAPFALFMSEFQILKAAADAKSYWVMGLFLAGVCIVFLGALRHAIAMAWGTPGGECKAEGAGRVEAALVYLPLGVLLVLGLWMPEFLHHALFQAAGIIGGQP